MPIATYNALKTSLQNPITSEKVYNGIFTGISGFNFVDLWRVGPLADAIPTAAVVPTNANLGGLEQQNPPTGDQHLLSVRGTSSYPCVFVLADRLSHQGGLSAIVTTAQTTNLPTAALTRYTSGEGVMLGITIYTQVGTTATTITANYTNQAGTPGRITTLKAIGNNGNREIHRLFVLPLQAGDTGVLSVQSVTVLATTGTAGAFGVTLFKPLAAVFLPGLTNSSTAANIISGRMHGLIPKVENNAAIFPIACALANTTFSTSLNVLTEYTS